MYWVMLAVFSTFMTILGRYNSNAEKIGGCCSSLEQNSERGFIFNRIQTFKVSQKVLINLFIRKKI